MKTRSISLIVLLVLSILSTGCAITIRSSFQDQCKAKSWTNDQCDVGFYDGVQQKFTKDNGNGGYEPSYNVLTRATALNMCNTRLEDLNGLLDYKNKDEAKFIKEFGLREYLERQEKIFKADCARLQLVDNYVNFRDFMGESSSVRRFHEQYFNTASIFVEDVTRAYPFINAQVEEARVNGNLKEVERVMWFSERTLGRKEPDPNDLEDSSKFVWKSVKIGVELVAYKIMDGEQPKDNSVEYVEGTRFEIASNGSIRRESKPSVKVFVPPNNYSSVVVIDKDRQGEVGFSLPDFVERTERVSSAEALMTEALFSKLFYEPDSQKRIPPKDPPAIILEIAPVGKSKVDIWEMNVNGWPLPPRYKNDTADNYSVEVKIKSSEKEDFDYSRPKQIEYFRKTWESTGRVVEYHRPKAPFDQSNLTSVSVFSKSINLVTVDGDVIQGVITPKSNKFLQDQPYQISYAHTQVGRRWMIWDEDGDGKYEKKKELAESGER